MITFRHAHFGGKSLFAVSAPLLSPFYNQFSCKLNSIPLEFILSFHSYSLSLSLSIYPKKKIILISNIWKRKDFNGSVYSHKCSYLKIICPIDYEDALHVLYAFYLLLILDISFSILTFFFSIVSNWTSPINEWKYTCIEYQRNKVLKNKQFLSVKHSKLI